MSTMTMTIGCDLSAYATISLPAGTDLSEENLKAIAAQIDEDGEWGGQDIAFVPDWETQSGLRVVRVGPDGEAPIVSDIPVDPGYYDAGQVLAAFLRGSQKGDGVQPLVEAGQVYRLIKDAEPKVCHTGFMSTPDGERVQIDFSVRKGATQAEKDLAFFSALCQKVQIDYLELGETAVAAE